MSLILNIEKILNVQVTISPPKYLLINNLIFALETLVTSKIHKHPNLITLFDEDNKVIRLKFVDYHYSTKVKKTKIRYQNQPW